MTNEPYTWEVFLSQPIHVMLAILIWLIIACIIWCAKKDIDSYDK